MQMNYESLSLTDQAIARPALDPGARLANAGRLRRAESQQPSSNASALMVARQEALRTESWENVAWLAIAVSGLSLLVMSLWV
jgi:hypothetical protein